MPLPSGLGWSNGFIFGKIVPKNEKLKLYSINYLKDIRLCFKNYCRLLRLFAIARVADLFFVKLNFVIIVKLICANYSEQG
jgi:hypothetical protein